MDITIQKIMELNPCKDGLYRLIDQLGNDFPKIKSFKVQDIIGGKNTIGDIVWLIAKMGYKAQALKYAIYCAELILPIYEGKHNDDRPRKAIDCAKLALTDLKNGGRVSAKNGFACREAGYAVYAGYARKSLVAYNADAITAYTDTADYAASSQAATAASATAAALDIVGIKIRVKMTDKLRQIIIEIS